MIESTTKKNDNEHYIREKLKMLENLIKPFLNKNYKNETFSLFHPWFHDFHGVPLPYSFPWFFNPYRKLIEYNSRNVNQKRIRKIKNMQFSLSLLKNIYRN